MKISNIAATFAVFAAINTVNVVHAATPTHAAPAAKTAHFDNFQRITNIWFATDNVEVQRANDSKVYNVRIYVNDNSNVRDHRRFMIDALKVAYLTGTKIDFSYMLSNNDIQEIAFPPR